ncbi:MAG: hypothetical protein H8E44_24620 [Planctomycetes bacterium]|nr:hypothetical protein [Planctomycetota bacterium]
MHRAGRIPRVETIVSLVFSLTLVFVVTGCLAQVVVPRYKKTKSTMRLGSNELTAEKSHLDFKAGHVGYGNPTESAELDLAHQFAEWERMCKKVNAASVDHFYPHIPLSDCWKGPGDYDFNPLEDQVQRTVKSAPDARFFLRLRVDVPDWWPKLHPNEITQYAHRNEGEENNVTGHWGRKTYPPSLASEVWKRDTEDLIRATVEYIVSRDWADRVIGCNPALYHGGEWFEEASMYNVKGDYSVLMQATFRQWLSQKYPDEDQNAIPDNVVPTPEERTVGDIGHLRDPAKRRRVIDYMTMHNELMADHAVRLCKVIKTASKGRILAGVYYGYTIELAVAGTQWLQNSGHLALDRVLHSPNVDYISTMLEYVHRKPGEFCWSFGPLDAARAHGKFYIGEDEFRTWLDKMDPRILYYIRPVMDPQQAVHILKRDFATMATHGSLMQVADLGGNWLDDPTLLECVGQLANLGREDWDRAPAAQIALFVDEKSWMYQGGKDADALNKPLVLDSLVDYFHIGAPIDIFLLSDLTDGLIPLDQYRLYVILNGFCLKPQQRDYIKTAVEKDDRHILWYYAPGFLTPDSANEQGMFDLTGIRIVYDLPPSKIQVEAGSETFGTSKQISPVFFAQQEENLEVLGCLQGSEKIGLCRKKMGDWTSVYSAAPCIPAKILRGFARDAGVHLYVESDDLILASKGLVAIHAGVDGEKTVRLPQVRRARNPLDARAGEMETDLLKVTLKKGETQFWVLRPTK